MKKWLEGAFEKVTQRVAKKAGEVAAEQAKKQAAARVEDLKTSAKDALRKAEEALFGPDSEAPAEVARSEAGKRDMKTEAETPAARRRASSDGEGGSLKRAREEADRRAAERASAEAAQEKKERAEIDDELAAMKRKLGKR